VILEPEVNEGTMQTLQPVLDPSPSGRPADAVLSAINELAAHVRSLGMHHADELLADLLLELHAGASTVVLPVTQAAWGD